MTHEQLAVVKQLRDEGYLVVIWTPEELGNVNIDDLEDTVISYGSDMIEMSMG